MRRQYRDHNPRMMTARFPSTCPETGKAIAAGDQIAYFPAERKAYHDSSKAAAQIRGLEFSKSWGMADADY